MFELIIGLVLFLGSHSIAMLRPAWRRQVIADFGRPVWMAAVALVSLLGLWLIVSGYGAARASLDPIILYQPPVWLRHLVLVLMVPVFPLLLAAYLPGRIQRATRHPMLAAVKLWALAHLLANGALADVLLFGAMLVWAVAERISLKRRQPEDTPVPGAPPGRWNDPLAIGAGLLLYVLFLLWAHQWLFGQAPLGS
jgi:uncharacterized membrane protein